MACYRDTLYTDLDIFLSFTIITTNSKKVNAVQFVYSSVSDPWHFDTDPVLSSVTFKMPTKSKFPSNKFFCLLLSVGTFTSVLKNTSY